MMKGSKFQHRQELADMLEQFLMQSEIVFSDQELSKEWFKIMMQRAGEIQNKLAVFNYVSNDQDTHEAVFDVPTAIQTPSSSLEGFVAPEEIYTQTAVPEQHTTTESQIQTEDISLELKEECNVAPLSEDKEVEDDISEDTVVVEQAEQKEDTVQEEALFVQKVLVAENPDFVAENKAEEGKEEVPDSAINKGDLEVNDMHANSETLADRLRGRAIGKLADTISLNERFLFSNELFNGNMEAFKRALNELDHIASIADAKRFIDKQLCVENEWNKNDYAVKSFINLVERKFN